MLHFNCSTFVVTFLVLPILFETFSFLIIIYHLVLVLLQFPTVLKENLWGIICLSAGVRPTLESCAETSISVQCASPKTGGKLVGVCSVCTRYVGWRKEQ